MFNNLNVSGPTSKKLISHLVPEKNGGVVEEKGPKAHIFGVTSLIRFSHLFNNLNAFGTTSMKRIPSLVPEEMEVW